MRLYSPAPADCRDCFEQLLELLRKQPKTSLGEHRILLPHGTEGGSYFAIVCQDRSENPLRIAHGGFQMILNPEDASLWLEIAKLALADSRQSATKQGF